MHQISGPSLEASLVSSSELTDPIQNNKRFKSQYTKLSNGLRVSAVSLPGVKTVSLRFFVFVGSIYETPEKNGISHFLEHMLFRGNEKLGDAYALSLKMEELGGEFNAATSFDQTEYWLDFHRDYLDLGIERFCQFLQFPLFEQLEVERSIILEEILSDYNEDNQLIDLDSLSSINLWPDQPMGLPIIGRPETVKKITKEDLVQWHQQFYYPGNIVLGISGDFDIPRVLQKIESHFEFGLPDKAKNSYATLCGTFPPKKQLELVNEKDNQYALQWSFPIYDLTKQLKVEYELIRRVLDDGNSSRIQRLIREEKGLVYDISVDMIYFDSGVVMSIQSAVGVNRLEELIEALVELLSDLISKGIKDRELGKAKLRYKAALECSNDTSQGVMFNQLSPLLYPSSGSLEEVLDVISSISLDRINRTFRKLIDQNLTTFVLVGPWDDDSKNMLSDKLHPWISGNSMSK